MQFGELGNLGDIIVQVFDFLDKVKNFLYFFTNLLFGHFFDSKAEGNIFINIHMREK